MAVIKFVSYLRVSTDKQGRSGLGLEAQREAVSRYLSGGQWTLMAEYVEVESGKRDSRPQLQAAISHAKATGAKLVIARLDRLARNLHFVSSLQERGVDFVAADMPDANRLTIHIIAAVAESVGRTISENTRTALAAAKARGVKLGKPSDHCAPLVTHGPSHQGRMDSIEHSRPYLKRCFTGGGFLGVGHEAHFKYLSARPRGSMRNQRRPCIPEVPYVISRA